MIRQVSESVQIAQHSERLLQLVDRLLHQSGWTLDQVDAFAVGRGPGSFTGIRVGLATARMFGQILDRPLIPFSSLDAWMNSLETLPETQEDPLWRMVVSEATQGEVYLGIAQRSGSKFEIKHEGLADWAQIPEILTEFCAAQQITLLRLVRTPCFQRAHDLLRSEAPGLELRFGVTAEELTPQGVAASAGRALKEGLKCSFRDATPVYLRVSDAEKKRLQ
jgi:tRNA threonylcarbamoyl adenosine modification protein YeaZ